jgi:hypothetical protein
MDKVTKGLIKQLVSRLEHISNAKPVGEVKTSHHGKHKADAEEKEPPPDIQTAGGVPNPPPTVTHEYITHKPERDWWDTVRPYVEISGAVLLAVYTFFTIKMYCANKQSADAATSAANTATAALRLGQLDQRAWLKVEGEPTKEGKKPDAQLIVGQPVLYPLQVRNMGKTSAKNIDMSIFVDILDALQEVPLGRISNPTDDPHGHISAGIVFPNEDFKHVVTRPGKDGQPLPLTDLEATAMNNGKAYLAIYGIVTYDDVFKVHHFTKFCDYRGTVGASTLKVQSCVAYNDADNNTENEK